MKDASDRVEIMNGRLADYDLAEVLQVVSIGRQFVAIELADGEQPRGTIYAIGGRVIAANAGEVEGIEAFFQLCEREVETFRILRVPPPPVSPKPLGLVRDLLNEHRLRRAPRRTIVEHLPVNAPCIIAVASPKGGAGKTTVALNLATSLARRGKRTVLVDSDLNGDLLAAIEANEYPRGGAYDVLFGGALLSRCLIRTTIPDLSVLPACGPSLPDPRALLTDLAPAWRELFRTLQQHAQLIIVDTAAGLYGPTFSILRAATHVLGVVLAETLAHRSFNVFSHALSTLAEHERPEVLGVVLNMLEGVPLDLAAMLPPSWLFDVTIPRHPNFLRFDALANEVADRLRSIG